MLGSRCPLLAPGVLPRRRESNAGQRPAHPRECVLAAQERHPVLRRGAGSQCQPKAGLVENAYFA